MATSSKFYERKLVIDNFAGGGGTSTGLEVGLGRAVDIAINHNAHAIAMHKRNHPNTEHYCEDVWHVDPVAAVRGKPVGLCWLSPDCTHHSQAAGGQPRSNVIRGLAWIGVKWAGKVRPDVLMLENVTQITAWGPLVAKRDKLTGLVVRLDGSVASVGERVPVQEQYLIPDNKRKGKTWRAFIRTLERMGYVVESKKLCAADYGAPTTRERLFMIARCDDKQIVWPEPTHSKRPDGSLMKWRSAAECIDFSIPCPSIFSRKKNLASATLRRIARGVQRYVLDSGDPFIVPIAHYNGSTVAHDINDPLRTITASTKGGEFSLIAPVLAKFRGDSIGTTLDKPLPTITAGGNSKRPAGSPHALGLISPIMVQAGHGDGQPGKTQRWGAGSKHASDPLGTIVASGGGHAVATAYLMQANGGFNTTLGHSVTEPISTITNTGSQQQLITANLVTLRNHCVGCDMTAPLPTITASGEHHAVVSTFLSSYYTDESNRCRSMLDPAATITTENRLGLVAASMIQTDYGKHANVYSGLKYHLSFEDESRALRMAEFMVSQSASPQSWDDLTHEERLAIVTVSVNGAPHVIVDIGLRMLSPRDLYKCQGFPSDYVIDHGAGGVIFSKSTQVRLVGNSVSPVIPAALARANLPDMIEIPDLTISSWKKAA